jgi:hypothetical protein
MKLLPYSRTVTFELNGNIYPDEASALRAAVEQALGNPGITTTVMRECCALAPLLSRACELGLGNRPPEAKD